MKTTPIIEARIDFGAEGPPRSPTFGDVYHPRGGAAVQARSVFLAGNGLPQRWRGRHRFTILETGFGLGNNMLATWQAWRDDPERCERLHLVSVELHPPSAADLRRAHLHSPWPDLADALVASWPPPTPNLHVLSFEQGRVQLTLAWGDAAKLLPQLGLHADALYLDGFAPACNPRMWDIAVLKALARRSAAGTTAATWSAAGALRRGLAAVGFEVSRQPGAGGKREVSHAVFRPRHEAPAPPPRPGADKRQAVVVGAGLAGAWTAHALAQQGWQVTVLERRDDVALENSGNPAGIFHGVVHGDDGVHARLFRAAALHAARALRPLVERGLVSGQVEGLLRLTDEPVERLHALIHALGLPADWVQALDREQASDRAGCSLPGAAWFFPGGGWVAPRGLVQHLLAQPGIVLHTGYSVVAVERDPGPAAHWQVRTSQGHTFAGAAAVVLANDQGASALVAPHGDADWPLTQRAASLQVGRSLRGHGPRLPLAGAGYAIGLPGGQLLRGGDEAHRLRLPDLMLQDQPPPMHRQGLRLYTPDRLPLAGPVALRPECWPEHGRRNPAHNLPRCEGLYVHTALASRGLTLAPLCGALVAAQISGAPLPLERDLAAAVDPGRFRVRAARRQAAT